MRKREKTLRRRSTKEIGDKDILCANFVLMILVEHKSIELGS